MFPASPTRRTLLRGALGLGTAAALTACRDGGTTARTSGDVTVSLWTHDPGYEDFFGKGIPEADRLTDFRYHLDITRAGPGDLVTKLLAQAVAGRGTPDAIGFEIGSFPRMLRGDIAPRLLHDLTPDIAAVPGLKDDLLPARLAPYSKDGRLYALDSDTPMVVYYYRADLFSQWNRHLGGVRRTRRPRAQGPRRLPLRRLHGRQRHGPGRPVLPDAALPARRRLLRRRREPGPRLPGGRGDPALPVRGTAHRTGYLTVFFLAGLQNVPRELYEAAALDGAGRLRTFTTVTLPALKPVTAFVVVTSFIGAAQIFEEPYLLTGGGPAESTLSVTMFIYRAAFQRQQFGYAAAAVVLFVLVFGLSQLFNRLLGIGRASA
ncbi:ABC transporter permease subunit [Streptomyces sp. NPDC102476]|uniref:ABC transporter permease subunit n=1 Tax=Streptomyces sp. NPDC102476 TaxID=3366181 RepID=UPI00380048C5